MAGIIDSLCVSLKAASREFKRVWQLQVNMGYPIGNKELSASMDALVAFFPSLTSRELLPNWKPPPSPQDFGNFDEDLFPSVGDINFERDFAA